MGHAVPAASEETDFLLQVVPLPERKVVELLDGHPENTEKLLLREVSLQGRETYTKTGTHRERERERERAREREREFSAVKTVI